MEGCWHPKFDALSPYRVVVVFAIKTEIIDPIGVAARIPRCGGSGWNNANHVPGQHYRLHFEHVHGIIQFANRFGRGMHWYYRNWSHPIAVFAKNVSMERVKGATSRPTQFLVLQVGRQEPQRGIEHRKIDSKLVEALIK